VVDRVVHQGVTSAGATVYWVDVYVSNTGTGAGIGAFRTDGAKRHLSLRNRADRNS